MATIKPFKALRPAADKASEMLSLPYDVMNRKEAFEMARNKPASFLHVSRAEIDLDNNISPYDPVVYKKARENLNAFIEKGWLIEEKKKSYYIYSQVMDGRRQTGLLACFPIDDYINGKIKQHELTRRDKEMDRINNFDYCSAHTEPVFLTFNDNDDFSSLLYDWINRHSPCYDIVAENKVKHELFLVDDDSYIEKLTKAAEKIDSVYIADGHHRSASSVKVGLKRRKQNPNYTGDEEFNFYMAVMFPETELKIMEYHRIITDLNGLTKDELLKKIEKAFVIKKTGDKPIKPDKKGDFTMCLKDGWYKLTIKPEFYSSDLIGNADVSLLHNNLLAPILGIKDIRSDTRIDFIGGIHGPEAIEKRVMTDMEIGFAVFPITTDYLMQVSDGNRIMPPKSTWFEPKLASGLFIHRF